MSVQEFKDRVGSHLTFPKNLGAMQHPMKMDTNLDIIHVDGGPLGVPVVPKGKKKNEIPLIFDFMICRLRRKLRPMEPIPHFSPCCSIDPIVSLSPVAHPCVPCKKLQIFSQCFYESEETIWLFCQSRSQPSILGQSVDTGHTDKRVGSILHFL